MIFSELFTKDSGVFSAIFKVEYPTEYSSIFGDIEPKMLDVYTWLQYGNRTLMTNITVDNANDVVSSIIALNLQGWVKEAEAMRAEYDVLTPVTGGVDSTEKITLTESNDTTETGANKAFNESDFSDSARTTKGDEKSRTETHTRNETSKGLGSGKSISTEIEKEIQLRREKWQKNIIFALVNDMTLSIYQETDEL